METARETGTFLFRGIRPTGFPRLSMTEVHCWENAAAFDIDALEPFVREWLDRAKKRAI